MFETDLEPQLPSPNQLMYKILIKNKKIRSLDNDANQFRNNNSIVRHLHRSSNASTVAGTTANEEVTTTTTTADDEFIEYDEFYEDLDEDELELKSNELTRVIIYVDRKKRNEHFLGVELEFE